MATEAIPVATLQEKSLPLYRFTVEQYHRLIEAGVFNGSERVELLEGWVVNKVTRNPPHDVTIWLVQTMLPALLPSGWILRTQSAITTRDSEPEPDGVIARGPGTRYCAAHPQPRDIALVIEVADTTLAEDRQVKGRLYARARIPVYWIINLPESRIEVYTEPRAGKSPAYRRQRDYGPEEAVPLMIADREIAQVSVRDLLPPNG
jgi:Uma2 family endonuclease